MADHSATATHPTATPSETPEAFLASRQQFWNGFTHFTLGCVIFVVLLLVGMAVFLL